MGKRGIPETEEEAWIRKAAAAAADHNLCKNS